MISVALSVAASPAGLKYSASTPETSPTFDPASAVLRAPTGSLISGAPEVPSRDDPAHAVPAVIIRTATAIPIDR